MFDLAVSGLMEGKFKTFLLGDWIIQSETFVSKRRGVYMLG